LKDSIKTAWIFKMCILKNVWLKIFGSQKFLKCSFGPKVMDCIKGNFRKKTI